MVEVLANKALFQDFAERHGLPVPRTVVVTEEGDLAGISHLSFPVIMKPADKRPVHTGATERIAVAETLAEAKVRCRQLLQTAGQLVVQEMIDGPDDTIYFSLFHCGAEQRQVDMFIGRKVACHPPRVGSTAVCVAAPEVSDELNPLTASFIEATAYLGLGSLEFKWDPKRRRFVIIEPTVGRTDWQEEIATLSGVNLPLAAYRYELGLPLLKPAQVEGAVAWRESYRHRKGCSRLPANTRIYDGYWRINDPLPAVFFYVDAAFRKIFGRLARQKAF